MSLEFTFVLAVAAGLAAGLWLGHWLIARPRTRRIVAAGDALLKDGPAALASVRLRDRGLEAMFGRLTERLASIELLATTDQLTGVHNRPTSLRMLQVEIDRSARHGRPIVVALADIDHFKRVNDTYGHAAGDLVLHHIAELIQSNLRTSDIVGRYGGEEFLIALPETDPDGGLAVIEKLRRAVGRNPVILPDGTELSVTMSIGVAASAGADLRLEQITHDADAALYAAKALGRDQVYGYREVDEARVVNRMPVSALARQTAASAGSAAAEAAEKQLSKLLARRPGWAGQPSTLIADLAVGLAEGLDLPAGELARIRTASLLHDVGKIAIPGELLATRATLTAEQWQSIREHPRTGQMVLEQAGALRDAAAIALHHHEWFDGRGYPNGLAGADIPIGARIVSIADAYEAMTTWRPYKRKRTPEEALAELRRSAGTQFDPALVELFVAIYGAALINAGEAKLAPAVG